MAAANGVAIDVPDKTAYPPRERGQVLRILPPTEENWGFRSNSYVGPQLV